VGNVAAKAASAALVAALALAAARRAPGTALFLIATFLLGTMLALATPGGRHPVLMALATFIASGLAFEVIATLTATRPHRTRWFGLTAVVLLGGWLLGSSSLPLALEVHVFSSAMDERAQHAITKPSFVDRSAFDRSRIGQPNEPDECPHHSGPYRGPLGPFRYCSSSTNDTGTAVAYNFGKAPLGFESHNDAGLIYAPGGPPLAPFPQCVAHVYGDWYEFYGGLGASEWCPAGLSHRP
jgi:hypothetical protein